MTVDTAVADRLLECAGVTALVGTHVYTVVLPQKSPLPAIRVQRISQIEPMHLRGPVNLFRARVQVDSVASSKAAADAVDLAVQGDGIGTTATGLKGWKGSVGSPAFVVHAVIPDGVRDEYTADELRQFRIMRDFIVEFEGVQ